MKYDLDSNGYILNVYEGCYAGECIEYTGTTPSGYSTIDDWMENANTRAYKIVSGNLVYDANKDAELQLKYNEEETTNKSVTQGYVDTMFSKSNSIITDELSTNVEGSSFISITDAGDYELPYIKLTSTATITDAIRVLTSNKNMLGITSLSTIVNGVTITINADHTIKLNGTATAAIEFDLDGTLTSTDLLFLLKNGTSYIKSGLATGVNLSLYSYNGTARTLINKGGNGTINLSSQAKITYTALSITSGTKFSNVTISPQLELGTTASTYAMHKESVIDINLMDFELTSTDYIEIKNNTIHLFKSSGLALFLGNYEELDSYSTMTIVMNDKGANASVNYFTYKYITTQLNSITSDVSGLTLSVTSNTNDITNLNTDVGTLSSDVDTLDTNVGTLSTNVGTLSTNVGTLSSSVKTLQGQVVTINKDYVKFTDLSTSGSTKINGSNITTGTIKSSNFVADTSGSKIDLTNGQILVNDDGGTEISSAKLLIGSTKSGNYISSRGITINDEDTSVSSGLGKNGLACTWKPNVSGEYNRIVDKVDSLVAQRLANHYKPSTAKGESVYIEATENNPSINIYKYTQASNGTQTITSQTKITDNGITINGKKILMGYEIYSGYSKTQITMTDSVANYDYIEIEATWAGAYSITKVLNANGKSTTITLPNWYDNNALQTLYSKVTFNGKIITFNHGGYVNIGGGGVSQSESPNIYITRVVGYK